MVLGNKNWKEITILPENPLAKDFEVRFKGKKSFGNKSNSYIRFKDEPFCRVGRVVI